MRAVPQWSLVIPAFNEASRLPATLRSIAEDMPAYGTFEVVVVDDGSTDSTAATAEEVAKQLGIAHQVVRLSRNQGKGAAVRAGVSLAEGEWVLLADADGAVPLRNLTRFVGLRGEYPVIIGSKYAHEERVKRKASRTLLARGSNWLIRHSFNFSFADTQCGFKLIRGDVAHDFFGRMRINRWAFDIELLALAQAEGIPVKEVGVEWNDDGYSRVGVVSSSLSSLAEVLRIKWLLATGAYVQPREITR